MTLLRADVHRPYFKLLKCAHRGICWTIPKEITKANTVQVTALDVTHLYGHIPGLNATFNLLMSDRPEMMKIASAGGA